MALRTDEICRCTGNEITDNDRGDLCVKGPTVVLKKFENDKATKESWDAGDYFKTWEVIEADPQTGLMCMVERLKEIVKVRGFQVAPAEWEGVLTAHPDIVDTTSVGVSVSDDVELPRAYILRRGTEGPRGRTGASTYAGAAGSLETA